MGAWAHRVVWLAAGVLLLFLSLAIYGHRLRESAAHLSVLRQPSEAIAGAYHVHSLRSHDGRVPVLRWAQQAKALGLDFIVLTDHNAAFEPPMMLEDVLVLFEREASLPWGHLVQWPGSSIAAHPFDAKRPYNELTHRATDLTGIEISSVSSNVRAAAGRLFIGVLPLLLMGFISPEAAMAQLYRRDERALQFWDGPQATEKAHLCGLDAHGLLPLSYELSMWRMVLPDIPRVRPLTLAQAPEILKELAAGHSACTSGLLPSAAAIELTRVSDCSSSESRVMARARGLHALSENRLMQLRLLRNGHIVCETFASQCVSNTAAAIGDRYRAELLVRAPTWMGPGSFVPLIYSSRLRIEAP